jgi:hypothetical protein
MHALNLRRIWATLRGWTTSDTIPGKYIYTGKRTLHWNDTHTPKLLMCKKCVLAVTSTKRSLTVM